MSNENPFVVHVTYTDDCPADYVYKSYNITQNYIEFQCANDDVFIVPLRNVYVLSMKANPNYVKES